MFMIIYIGQNQFGLDGYISVVENDWKGINDLLIYNLNEQAFSYNCKYFEEVNAMLALVVAKSKTLSIETYMKNKIMRKYIKNMLEKKGMKV